ncbi:MAG: SDR family oxidoreductase, partial [Candidatus Aquilonibacter sp.]
LIATEFHATAGLPERLERLRSTVPMLRDGSAEEVADAILWLMSDHSSYITGAVIPVTGGR